MLNPNQLQQFRMILEEEKKALLEQTQVTVPLSERDTVGELSGYDNHPADMGTELFEREKDIALNQLTQRDLVAINQALEAINNGKYGLCTICQAEIPLERLEAIPTTLYCKEHSPVQVVQPNEQTERQSSTGIRRTGDTEDVLQDVMNYGSSETPSDFMTNRDLSFNELFVEAEENIGYTEDYENFIGTDIDGNNNTVYNLTKNEQDKSLNIKTLEDLANEADEDFM